MGGKNIIFNDKNINKSNFYKNKRLFKIDDIDINRILVSKKELHGKKSSFKYFFGYDDNDDIRLLCIKLPQMTGYAKYSESNKTMSFKVIDKKLLKKYTKIWNKISSVMNIKFDGDPVYGDNKKLIKVKTKLYVDKVYTNFQDKKVRKENTSYRCFVNNNVRLCY